MGDRWKEQKEKLVSLRVEYEALFRHFHFMQGLRFATLAAMMPILGALFNYYRTALPFSQFRALRQGVSVNIDSTTAVVAAVMGLSVLYAMRSIEFGIGIQTRAIADRGSEIEARLDIYNGVLTVLQGRLNSSDPNRITDIITLGYRVGVCICSFLVVMGIWAGTK